MTKITEIYADRLVPLLKLNLGKLGKPVPSDANLRLIAIGLIEKAEEKKVALTSSALSYIAFLYANVYAAGPVEFEKGLDQQREPLLVAELLPVVRSQLAASDGNAEDLEARAVKVAGELASELLNKAG
ncbi:MAG: hypothetical protein U0842_08150 [Candidatus Binatia bacterium]|jgi:hypothetical protein